MFQVGEKIKSVRTGTIGEIISVESDTYTIKLISSSNEGLIGKVVSQKKEVVHRTGRKLTKLDRALT